MHRDELFNKPTTIAHNSYPTANTGAWVQLAGPNHKRVAVVLSHSNATPIAVCLGDPGSTSGRPGFWVSGNNAVELTRDKIGAAIELPIYVYDNEVAGQYVNVDEIIAP